MNPAELTALLWTAVAVFIISGVAVGRLLRRLPDSRGVFLVGRLLQACCCIGTLVCLTGIVLGAFH